MGNGNGHGQTNAKPNGDGAAMKRSAGGKRLYIGNLPYGMDEPGLVEAFGSFGFAVSRPHIVMDRESGRSKGFGFVEVASDKEAEQIVASLDGTIIGGRTVRVDHAVDRPRGDRGDRASR
jgi:RNA recognition motif-containing protein